MTPTILGISAFYHDSAAAIIRGGEIVAAAQEERFTRRKHDPSFPHNAVNYCLGEAFIDPNELDAVVFYDHPLWTLDRVVRTIISSAPSSKAQWGKAARSVLGNKVWVEQLVRERLSGDYPFYLTEHHASHAASAFYPSPFEESAILTFDGVGEWATTTLGHGEGNKIRLIKEITFPHSLGLLYSAFTYFCGFKVNAGEYKLMGLAPYGTPIYANKIREKLIDIKEDGSFRLNMEYFGYLDSDRMINGRFADLFGGPERMPESAITRREVDLASSIQAVTEEVVLRTARHLRSLTGSTSLVMAGGVALNCVANGLLAREQIFDRIWIQPAAGDAGGSLGSALLVAFNRFGVERKVIVGRDSQRGSYLGPSFSSEQVRAFLDRNGSVYKRIEDSDERYRMIAEFLAEGKVVGLLNGRMEFGPRALGNRSILGDPRRPDTQSTMNLKIKYRESFRPFAPSVLKEKCSDYFETDVESPYMLLVSPVRREHRLDANEPRSDDLREMVNRVRSTIPAVTHVDNSARIQTVAEEDNPVFYGIIREFEKLTGIPIVVNTSFNVRGEPIVCTPDDAYTCFMRTEMDVLILEDCILLKTDQPPRDLDDGWTMEYDMD